MKTDEQLKTINLLIYLGRRTYKSREFKEPRRRRQGQRRFNNKSLGTLKSFSLSLSKLSKKWN